MHIIDSTPPFLVVLLIIHRVSSFCQSLNDQTRVDYGSSFTKSFDFGSLHPILDSGFDDDEIIHDGEFPSEEDLFLLPVGTKGGFRILREYFVKDDQFTAKYSDSILTIQTALCYLDPENYPTLSRARKTCRNGACLIHRGSVHGNDRMHVYSKESIRARVGDIVLPGDVIAIQAMVGTFRKKRCYPFIGYAKPEYHLPVLYEDDHIAVVDKPSGVSMYGQRQGKSGSLSRRTLRDMLPYVLTPPQKGTQGQLLRRPMAVHRLDAPTSGLVIVAKTKLALDCLYRQFEDRRIFKTYTAIVNGILQNVEKTNSSDWNKIDYPLGGKSCMTYWKTLRIAKSLHAKDGILSLVQVRPATGRFHQIRRHFAWIGRRPIVGDPIYAGLLQAPRFARGGLYLCSNGVTFEHPYYSCDIGRGALSDDIYRFQTVRHVEGGSVSFQKSDNSLQIYVEKTLPKRFHKLMDGEESWAMRKLHQFDHLPK